MKGLKLFTLSIGLVTSFGICNNSFCMEKVNSVNQAELNQTEEATKIKIEQKLQNINTDLTKLHELARKYYKDFRNSPIFTEPILNEYRRISKAFYSLPEDAKYVNEELWNEINDDLDYFSIDGD